MKKLFLFLFIFNSLLSLTAQINIPERPKQIPFVIDSTNTLSINEKAILNHKLKNYCLKTSTEILVMMVSSVNGTKIETYAKTLGQKWGIGKLGKDNGIVIFIAKNDRNMTIQNGHGIEPILSDAQTKRIIDQEITPNFKNADFFKGISQGVNAIFDILKNEFTNESNTVAIQNFITETNPPTDNLATNANTVTPEEKTATTEGEPLGFNSLMIIIGIFLIIGFFIILAVVRLINGQDMLGNTVSGYTNMGGYGVRNNFYMRPRFYNSNRNSNYSSSGGNSSSYSGGSSGGSYSSGSSSSGSGGTFGGGGASGSW